VRNSKLGIQNKPPNLKQIKHNGKGSNKKKQKRREKKTKCSKKEKKTL